MVNIGFETEYIQGRDVTIIFENMYETKGHDKVRIRERICGFYYGRPNKEDTKYFLDKGCDSVMDDNGLLGSLIEDK